MAKLIDGQENSGSRRIGNDTGRSNRISIFRRAFLERQMGRTTRPQSRSKCFDFAASMVPGFLFSISKNNVIERAHVKKHDLIAYPIAASLGGKSLYELKNIITPEILDEAIARIEYARSTGEPQEMEFDFTQGGIVIHYLARAVCENDDGRVYVNVHDITQKKEAHMALEREKVEEANKKMMNALRTIMHDMAQPIHLAHGYGSVLKDCIETQEKTPDDENQLKNYADIIITQLIQLDKLREDLQTFALASTDSLGTIMRPAPLELPQFLLGTVEANRITSPDIKLDFINRGKVIALADESSLQRVANNLISNAMKYNRTGGSIEVSCSYEEREGKAYATFSVKDTGIGIPNDKLEEIFNPMVRLRNPNAKKGTRGLGLGLANTKALVEAMDGFIEVKSIMGIGSTFTVYLPTA